MKVSTYYALGWDNRNVRKWLVEDLFFRKKKILLLLASMHNSYKRSILDCNFFDSKNHSSVQYIYIYIYIYIYTG